MRPVPSANGAVYSNSSVSGAKKAKKTKGVRGGRPNWSYAWSQGKTGGAHTNRRHGVRSGLIRQALKRVYAWVQEQGLEKEFRNKALEVLKFESDSRMAKADTELILDKLYSRLHNNHMNIFYGRGSYNQAIGCFAHGLESKSVKLKHDLEKAKCVFEAEMVAFQWLMDVTSYALCEYMGFTKQQVGEVRKAVDNVIDVSARGEIAKNLEVALEKIELFREPKHYQGPMQVKVLKEKLAAVAEISQVAAQMIDVSCDENQQDLNGLKDALFNIAGNLETSTNFDISESADPKIRRIQNKYGLLVNDGLEKLLAEPSLDRLMEVCAIFLDMERLGAEALGFTTADYKAWFKDPHMRQDFFTAITSDVEAAPTLESPRFNPKEWSSEIKESFKPRLGQQRLHWVPTKDVRHAAWAISDIHFSEGRQEELYRMYEKLVGAPRMSISSEEELQETHFKVVNKIHNTPANLYLADSGKQMALDNLVFAIKSILTDRVQELADIHDRRELKKAAYEIVGEIISSGASAFLNLVPSEAEGLNSLVSEAIVEYPSSDISAKLATIFKENLKVFDRESQDPRYTHYDFVVMRAKALEVANLAEFLRTDLESIFDNEGLSLNPRELFQNRLDNRITFFSKPAFHHKKERSQKQVQRLLFLRMRLQDLSNPNPDPSSYANRTQEYQEILQELLDLDNSATHVKV